MVRSRFFATVVLFGAFTLIAGGCAGTDEGSKVTGSVTQGGKALEAVSVNFISGDQKAAPSKGTRTNAEGKFELKMKAGNYTVVLSKMVDKKGNTPKESENPTEDVAQLEASGYLRQVMPAKYTDPGQSPFKVEIPAGGKELPPFEVK